MKTSSRTFLSISAVITGIAAGLLLPTGPSPSTDETNQIVVYCAHDSTFATAVLERFKQQTGIHVDVRFDEEANKSLGLTNLLIAEKSNPRCDVFWNNQTLGTIRLLFNDVLQPYISKNSQRIPNAFRDADGYWTGFAARLRVFIINTDNMNATEEAVATALNAPSLSRVTIAQPLFGTTLSHYSVLWDQWGPEKTKHWHTSIHGRGIRQVRGNSMTRDLVAEGICDLGFTDTDDAFGAIDNGKPVAILPVRLENGKTICLPNSVAMIKNCPHPDAAGQFIDFLLSEETELQLAGSAARQIPLGTVDVSRLPPEVLDLMPWAADGIALSGAANVNQEVLDWLAAEHTGQ